MFLYFLAADWYKASRDPNDDAVAVRWQKRFDRGVVLIALPDPDSLLSECDFGRGPARLSARRFRRGSGQMAKGS